jgi:hypothetical protein
MDDGKHHEPTKKIIMDGFRRLVEISEPGDVVFIQFSGTYQYQYQYQYRYQTASLSLV